MGQAVRLHLLSRASLMGLILQACVPITDAVDNTRRRGEWGHTAGGNQQVSGKGSRPRFLENRRHRRLLRLRITFVGHLTSFIDPLVERGIGQLVS